MDLIDNPFRGHGLPPGDDRAQGTVSVDADLVLALLAHCPAAAETPLRSLEALAAELGIGALLVKDERGRMGLGSFKALGAAYAIAKQAHQAVGDTVKDPDVAARALRGHTFVAASAGNHGLSVAAGARVFGARAVIYLAETVPAAFADRLRGFGAEVVVEGSDYEASMAAAAGAAAEHGWHLLSDSTWTGYTGGRDVMEGYLAMAAEITAQVGDTPPTHVFLQAGVGGLAAAMAAYMHRHWGDRPVLCVVEPAAAPALQKSILAGAPVHAGGPVSIMGRLDCKEPSHLALDSLARDADAFMTLSDDAVSHAITRLAPFDLATSPSGGAGFAGLCAAAEVGALGLNGDSRVLVILSEGEAGD